MSERDAMMQSIAQGDDWWVIVNDGEKFDCVGSYPTQEDAESIARQRPEGWARAVPTERLLAVLSGAERIE